MKDDRPTFNEARAELREAWEQFYHAFVNAWWDAAHSPWFWLVYGIILAGVILFEVLM